MDFPATRHWQRYEYILQRGWCNGKNVLEVGCGLCYGTTMLSQTAEAIWAVDLEPTPFAKSPQVAMVWFGNPRMERIRFLQADAMRLPEDHTFDVGVAVEVFEHVPDPEAFAAKLARLCRWCFLTTPLAERTAPTDNPDHVAEYSRDDFLAILGRSFVVRELTYQRSDLTLRDWAEPNGSSINPGHVVQMAWCESKLFPRS